MDGARRSFEAYGRMPDQGINALDSLGEALFMNGKFQEAAQQFLEAHAKNPAFLGGETLWKAAHARWLGGDRPAADTLAKDFFDQRAKMHDPLLDWHRANWLYETGRRDEAVAVLTNAAPLPGDLAHKQLAVWADPQSVPRDLIALKRAYETTAPTDDGVVRTFYAAALLQAGQREEAGKLVALWPLPKSQDALQALMYPAFQAVRKATAPPH
jgi:tetratricopeptide (TPR) repeat protein